jgi:hypothetical protein
MMAQSKVHHEYLLQETHKERTRTKDYIEGASTKSALQPRAPSSTEYSHRSSHQTSMYHSGSQRS